MSAAVKHTDDVAMVIVQNSTVVFLTNGICENTDITSAEQFDELGLNYQAFSDGSFYPLSDEEELFIADRLEPLDDQGRFPALMGYSVIIDGKKYFAPTIEIGYTDESEHSHSYEEAYDLNQKAFPIAKAVAEATGGLIQWSDDEAEVGYDGAGRFVTEIYIPVDYAVGTFPGYDSYMEHLKSIVRHAA